MLLLNTFVCCAPLCWYICSNKELVKFLLSAVLKRPRQMQAVRMFSILVHITQTQFTHSKYSVSVVQCLKYKKVEQVTRVQTH